MLFQWNCENNTVKSHYKFGISEIAKALMIKRDQSRASIKQAGPSEKAVLLVKFKKLRNLVNSNIRNESVAYNNEGPYKSALVAAPGSYCGATC